MFKQFLTNSEKLILLAQNPEHLNHGNQNIDIADEM